MPDQELLDDFLEALEQSGSPVKNPVLRQQLGWDEATYEAAKAELVGRRIVVRGRGRSDSVSLVGAEAVEQPAQAANGSSPSGNGRGRPAGRNAKGTGAEPKDKSLESWIWDAACSIRGAKDAAKYKDYILPLIFTKRLCDVFDNELNRIAEQVGSRAKAFQLVAGVTAFGEALGEGYQISNLLRRCESRVMPSFSVAASYMSKMAEQATSHYNHVSNPWRKSG
jgi:hypothetical protein